MRELGASLASRSTFAPELTASYVRRSPTTRGRQTRRRERVVVEYTGQEVVEHAQTAGQRLVASAKRLKNLSVTDFETLSSESQPHCGPSSMQSCCWGVDSTSYSSFTRPDRGQTQGVNRQGWWWR